MPLLSHLEELRQCLIRCLTAIGVSFIFTYTFAKPIFHFLMAPVLASLGDQGKLYFTNLSDPFLIELKVGFYGALAVAAPFLFLQIWRFVAPGLYQRERRSVLVMVFFSSILFFAGVAFAYYVVFPFGFRFFLSFGTTSIQPMLTIDRYLKVASQLLLGFGLIFQVPIILLGLAVMGLIHARQIAGFWRYALVIIAIISAILTPPDLLSMAFMMVPMILLYGLSILLAFAFGKRNKVKNLPITDT